MTHNSRPGIFHTLSGFMQAAPSFEAATRQEIEQFFAFCKDGMDTDSEKLLATLYLKALNQKIHSEGLQVQFRVNEDDLHRKIVPVTLQNLIENAIKHNIIDEESPLLVEVFTENGYFAVRNNLQKKTSLKPVTNAD